MSQFQTLQWPPPKHWQTWENLLLSLFRAQWGDPTAQKNGRSGQAQGGVDIFGKPSGLGGWAGIQCKAKDNLIRQSLSVRELQDEVRKARGFRPKLQMFLIATTSPRDARLQQEARRITDRHLRQRLFSVQVYCWEDIMELLEDHPGVFQQYYMPSLSISSTSRPLISEQEMTQPSNASKRMAATPVTPLVLPIQTTRLLGMIAASPLPLPAAAYELFLPSVNWKKEIQLLTTAGALDDSGVALRVPEWVVESLFPTPDAKTPVVDEWFNLLQPLWSYPDTALMLGMLHRDQGDLAAAASIVLSAAEAVDSGIWADLLSDFLTSLSNAGAAKQLEPEERLRFLRVMALRTGKGHSPRDALPWIVRLRREARRLNSRWGIAQSLLLTGLTQASLGHHEHAVIAYQKAAAYTKRHRLHFLTGHITHNLAMELVHSDPDAADKALSESQRYRKLAGDSIGRVGTLIGRGNVAARKGTPDVAERHFRNAEKLAVRHDLPHARVTALVNIGSSLVDQGKVNDGLVYYKAAEKISRSEGFRDGMAMSVGGQANALYLLSRFAPAARQFLRLVDLERENSSDEGAMIALHSAGACLVARKRAIEGRKILRRALAAAVACESPEWILQCEKDVALSFTQEGRPARTVSALKDAAARQEAARRFLLAAQIWEFVASLLKGQKAEASTIAAAFLESLRVLRKAPDSVDLQIRLHHGLFVSYWDCLRVREAMKTLKEVRRIAKKFHRSAEEIGAIDQQGLCLQQLDRPTEAIRYHRTALAMARRRRESRAIERSLNNLGEAYRKIGKPNDAVKAFVAAEALAARRGDLLAEIQTAHNRALALEDMGKCDEALLEIRRCRNESRRHEFWSEYVRALHGEASLAWQMKKPVAAERGYAFALEMAKKHEAIEHLGPISENYAHFFRVRGEPAKALAIMQSSRSDYSTDPDYHRFLGVMAEIALEARRWEVARQLWKESMDRAELAEDVNSVAVALHGLAEIAAEKGNMDEAERLIRKALSRETSPECRANLLIAQLGIAWKAGQHKRADRLLQSFDRFSHEHELAGHRVDAHMLAADQKWSLGDHQDALKAYLAAVVYSLAADTEYVAMMEVGMHITNRLLGLPKASRAQKVSHLHVLLRKWLARNGIEAANTIDFLLWPFRVALRCQSLNREDCLDRVGTDIIADEVVRYPLK